jgi:hypothetical protein
LSGVDGIEDDEALPSTTITGDICLSRASASSSSSPLSKGRLALGVNGGVGSGVKEIRGASSHDGEDGAAANDIKLVSAMTLCLSSSLSSASASLRMANAISTFASANRAAANALAALTCCSALALLLDEEVLITSERSRDKPLSGVEDLVAAATIARETSPFDVEDRVTIAELVPSDMTIA